MKPIAKAHGQSYGETGGVGIPEGQQEVRRSLELGKPGKMTIER